MIGVKNSVPYYLSLLHVFVIDFSLLTYSIYLAEITSPTFRAFFIVLYLFEEIGVEKKIQTALGDTESGIYQMFRDCAIVTSFSLLLSMFVPETPFFVMLKGNPEKAEETFRWLRGGASNTSEFRQMIARAENITETNLFQQHIVSKTFILGLMFSFFLLLCVFEPCVALNTFLNDFYIPLDKKIDRITDKELRDIDFAKGQVGEYVRLYIVSLFLVYNFIVPRKIIFLVSYVSSVLIIAIITLKLGTIELLIKIAPYCNLTEIIGLSPLVLILPVEVSFFI